MMVQEMMPEAFSDMTVAEVLAWTLGQNSHVDPLSDLTGHQVHQQLGIPILMLGCWACLAASSPFLKTTNTFTPSQQQAALSKVWTAPHMDLMAPVCDFLRRQEDQGPDCRDPAFPPGPRLLIKAILDDMDGAKASGRAPLTRRASG